MNTYRLKLAAFGLGPYLFHCDKMRTIAYIDGFNLYYGLLKGTPYKWLDR